LGGGIDVESTARGTPAVPESIDPAIILDTCQIRGFHPFEDDDA